jgi:hypothetical protein
MISPHPSPLSIGGFMRSCDCCGVFTIQKLMTKFGICIHCAYKRKVVV